MAIQKATRARELFGPTAKLMVDTYMSWNKAVAAEMARRLAQFNLYWYEDILTLTTLKARRRCRRW